MRLQAMRRPNPLHAAMADPGGFGHRPAGPVRGLACRLAERHLDHPFDHRRRQGRLAGRPRRLMQQPVNTFCHEARLPAPDRRLAFARLPLNFHRADTVSTQQHDPSPPHNCSRLLPDPTMASSRLRSLGPRRTSTPVLIPADSHIRKPLGIVRQRRPTSVRPSVGHRDNSPGNGPTCQLAGSTLDRRFGGAFAALQPVADSFPDQQPPGPDDLVIFNSGDARVNEANGLVAGNRRRPDDHLTIRNNLEATGSLALRKPRQVRRRRPRGRQQQRGNRRQQRRDDRYRCRGCRSASTKCEHGPRHRPAARWTTTAWSSYNDRAGGSRNGDGLARARSSSSPATCRAPRTAS